MDNEIKSTITHEDVGKALLAPVLIAMGVDKNQNWYKTITYIRPLEIFEIKYGDGELKRIRGRQSAINIYNDL